MVSEDGCEGDLSLDENRCEFEDGGLSVRACLAIDLIAREHNKVWCLVIQDPIDESEGARIRVAFATVVFARGLRVATEAGSSSQMKISHLKNLELAIAIDMESRFLDLMGGTPPDCQISPLIFAADVWKNERLRGTLPTWAGFDRIGSKKDIHRRDCSIFVGISMLGCALQPDACLSRLPALGALILFRGDRVKAADPHIKDDAIGLLELRLALAFDVDECV